MKNELKQENIGKFIVDREVNHPEKRRPRRLIWLTRRSTIRSFNLVDQEVNHPDK